MPVSALAPIAYWFTHTHYIFCVGFQGRLKPGRMLLVDTLEKVVTKDEELKLHIARSRPHSQWIQEQVNMFDNLL